jgi:hypothetical protein
LDVVWRAVGPVFVNVMDGETVGSAANLAGASQEFSGASVMLQPADNVAAIGASLRAVLSL